MGSVGRRRLAATVGVLAALCTIPSAAAGATGDLAYVGCLGGNDCTSVSPDPTPTDNTGIAVSPDGKSVYMTSQGPNGIYEFTRDPATSALALLGCIGSVSPCTGTDPADALNGATAVAVSPSGAYVYVASRTADTVSVFSRNETTGALTFDSCVGDDTDAGCTPVPAQYTNGLSDPLALTVSPDGKFVYVGSVENELDVLAQSATGGLTFSSCLGNDPACTMLPSQFGTAAVGDNDSLAMSPDGDYVYAVGLNSAVVASFARDTTSGALSLTDCVASVSEPVTGCTTATGYDLNYLQSIAISPDGRDLYVPSYNGDSLIELSASAAGAISVTGCIGDNTGCTATTPSHVLDGGNAVAVSGDGDSVYEGSNNGITEFARDPSTGALTQSGCFGGSAPCTTTSDEVGTEQSTFLAMAPDGASVYDTDVSSPQIAAFSRIVPPITCQAVSAAVKYETQATVALNCSDSEGLPLTYSIVSKPAHGVATVSGASIVYTPAAGFSGSDSLTVDASDFEGMSSPATVTVTVASPPPPPPATQTKSATIGDQRVTATAPVSSACVAAPKRLSVSLSAKPLHGGFAVKLSGASLYVDKGVKRRSRKHGHSVVTYIADAVVHRLPATIRLSVAGLKPGSHTLTIRLAYTRIERKHRRKVEVKVTGKITLKFSIC